MSVENNKIIAEFMGWTPCDSNDNTMYANPQDHSDVWSTDEMRYHTSWDWLMPVVEKINLLDDYRYTTYIASMDTRIEDNITGGVIVDVNCKHSVDELLQSVYQAVVEFIKQLKQ